MIANRLGSWLSIIGLLAALCCHAAAHAGDFQPGTYTYTNKEGVKVWQLHFSQDPKVRTYYRVTGTVGSIVRVPVRGGYSTTHNSLSASWAPVPGMPFGLADIKGEWRAEQDEFNVHYYGGPGIHLKFDAAAPDPTAMSLSIKNIEIEPAVNGAILKGRFTLGVSQFRNDNPLAFFLTIDDGSMAPGLKRAGASAVLHPAGDGDVAVDFSLAPVMVPQDTDSVRITISVYSQDAAPSNVEVTREVAAAGQHRPVMVDSFVAKAPIKGVAPESIGEVAWVYGLRSFIDASFDKDHAQVFETVTITSKDRPGEVIKTPPVEYNMPCSPDAEVLHQHALPNSLELNPGEYHAVVRIEGPDVQTYNGVITFFVKAPSRRITPKREEDPPFLSGTVTLGTTSLKPGEVTSLTVRYGFEKGPGGVDVDSEIEIIDPDGKVVADKKRISVIKGKQAVQRYDISSKTPGVHTVKVRVKGEKCNPWSESDNFTVEKPVAPPPPVQPKPPADQQGNAAEQGTFGLVKKVVGKAPEPGDGRDGVISGSISQNACSFQFVAKPPYDGTISFQATFSAPPAVLRPGDIIELTCSGSASESGRDKHNMGIGCGWGAIGSCEMIEAKKFFIGRASDGKFYPSGEGKFKVKIESGGKIRLIASQGGMAWGTGAIWNPCEYFYEWNAAPIEPKEEGTGKDKDKETEKEEPGGPTLTPAGPDPQDEQVIRAWLDRTEITLFAGETGEIVDIHIEGFRTSTLDRVEVLFPQKTDNWASLPGRIIVDGGDGSYDPANMGRPVHIDGYFFSARHTALAAELEIDIIVRQNGAGEERLKLAVTVVPKPAALDPLVDPGAGGGAGGKGGGGNPPGRLPQPPSGKTQPPRPPPQGNTSGPAQNFAGRWTTKLGPITLTQNDTMVSGTYPGGIIRGNVAGNTLTLRMDERALSPIPGFGRWVLNAKGDEFAGAWSNAQDLSPPLRVWTGQRVTTGGASPHVTNPKGAEPTDPARKPGDPPKPPADKPKPGTLDLNPGNLARNGWNSVGDGGAGVKVEGDGLVFDVPKASDGAAESFAATPLDGDFDISIDYNHLDWNAGDEASLSWSAFLSPVPHTESRELIQVMRTSGEGAGEVIVNPSSQAEPISVPAVSDRKGTIRIARTGNSVKVWQADGNAWRQAAAFETALPRTLHLGFILERQGDASAKVTLTPHPTR